MAHKRKDTLTVAPEWWKHLRPYLKRAVAKRERVAAKRDIEGLVKFKRNELINNMQNLDPQIAWELNENFWDFI